MRVRRYRNSISCVKDVHDNFVMGVKVFQVAKKLYRLLLALPLQHRDTANCPSSWRFITGSIYKLNTPISPSEIEKVVLSSNILKALGVDGLVPVFSRHVGILSNLMSLKLF